MEEERDEGAQDTEPPQSGLRGSAVDGGLRLHVFVDGELVRLLPMARGGEAEGSVHGTACGPEMLRI